MTNYIPRLARISSGKGAAPKRMPLGERVQETAVSVDRIARRLPEFRRSLAVTRQFSDEALLASLVAIARHPSNETRWRAAEASTLGQYLVSNGKDMHRTLVTLLSLLPQPAL